MSQEPGQEAPSQYLRVKLAQVRDELLRKLRHESRELFYDFERLDPAAKAAGKDKETLIARKVGTLEASREGGSNLADSGDAAASAPPSNEFKPAKGSEAGQTHKREGTGGEEPLAKRARDLGNSTRDERDTGLVQPEEVKSEARVSKKNTEGAEAELDVRPALEVLDDAATEPSRSSEALPSAVESPDCVPPTTPMVVEDKPSREETGFLCLGTLGTVANKADRFERSDVTNNRERESQETTLKFAAHVLDGVCKRSTVGLGFKRKRHGDRPTQRRLEVSNSFLHNPPF